MGRSTNYNCFVCLRSDVDERNDGRSSCPGRRSVKHTMACTVEVKVIVVVVEVELKVWEWRRCMEYKGRSQSTKGKR